MAGSSISESMDVLFGHLETMLKAKTIFGEPVVLGDVTLIPVIDIAFGAASGGAQEKSERGPAAGGGAGARVTAAAVIVVRGSEVQVMKLKNATPLERLLDFVPEILQSVKKDKPVTEKAVEA